MISRNIVIAREAIKAFNCGWMDCLSDMLAPDATYIDESRGITVQGVDAFKVTARQLRMSLPHALEDTRFEDEGDVVRARATVTEPGDFLEVLEFDANGKISKITASYRRTITLPDAQPATV